MGSETDSSGDPPRQRHPLWYRAIKSAYRLGDRLGLVRPLDPERLKARAIKSERRAFADRSFEGGLDALVSSVNAEAQLNGFGRLMLTALINRYLRQRLRLEAWREAHPDIERQEVRQPLIIAGLPRTGTTFLHQLLSQDEQFRTPRTFEIDRPVPPPRADAVERDPRVRQIQRGIDVIHRIVPHFQAIHPLGATLPEECQNITAYQFSSIAFQHILEVPGFRRWLLDHDFTVDLQFHRRFLQHLQSAWHRDRWLLKSPAHVQYLKTLLAVYPDAMVIHTHRDPGEVMASVSSLSWTMQAVFSDAADPRVTGRGQLDFWQRVLEQCLRDREALGDSPAIYDLRYRDLIADPLAAVEALYRHFGLPLGARARSRMAAFIAAGAGKDGGSHRYEAADFGVERLHDIAVFQRYRHRFAV